MEEYIVGPVLDKLIESLTHYVQDQFRWEIGMKMQLKRMQENYPKIQAVVSTAKRAQIEDQNLALNKWIWQLRDAIDEADDLLDEFEFKKYKKSTILWNIIKVCRRALKIYPDLKRLSKVVQKLDKNLIEVDTFLPLLKNLKQQQQVLHKTRQTISLTTYYLIGRAKDKDSVIEWLRKPSNKEHQTHVTSIASYPNISLLSIVGDGGMGKTSLLQHVYQDEITKEFDLKMWVCVSDDFDVHKVLTDMLECIENVRPSLDSLHEFQQRIRSKVMSKKFLLVLDDLWDKEEEVVLLSKWANVLAPLAYGGLGSKILITTRMDSVASMIAKVLGKKKEALRLEGLEKDECLRLLTTHAFAVGENPNDHKNLKSIAGELVKKLYGSALAAKVMGGILNYSLDESHWRNVLNNTLGLIGILPILKLSFTFLPEHLQSCFAFCSIFEQDHLFDKEDLVRMWIAVGFIQPSFNNQEEALTLEDIGAGYFDELINKSFFDKVAYGLIGGYKMNNLILELAQSISKHECFRFVGDDESMLLQIPETIRHLSVKTRNPKVLKNLGRFKNLRTLLITSSIQSFVDALNKMFKVTRSIRLLHTSHESYIYKLRVIPKNIGYLHHLRYLRFPVYKGRLLPRSISSLYHLQFIKFDDDPHIVSPDDYFPRDMNNLCNLRYLSSDNLDFPGIGKLKFLQQIREFRIKNEDGYRIEELEQLNELGILEINNIKDVRDAEEAYNAKLSDKRKLTELYLKWGIGIEEEEEEFGDRDLYERVLNNLQPHNYLKILSINNYMGVRSAIWMNEAYLINNLQEIYLSDCLKWEILPPFGQLPFLKTLELQNMPKVKRLENKFRENDECSVFPSLEKLTFKNLEALVDWFDASVVDGLFPCLTNLILSNCPNLQELPYLPPKLESLQIDNIGWKTLNCCSISKSIPLAGEIVKLKSLTIINCPNLISLIREELQEQVDAVENCHLMLNELIISDPSVLQMEPLRSYTSITSLKIENNDELVSFPLETELWLLRVRSSLRRLEFKNLQSLQSLPSSLASITSLEKLYISNLPLLRELPKLPPSLKCVSGILSSQLLIMVSRWRKDRGKAKITEIITVSSDSENEDLPSTTNKQPRKEVELPSNSRLLLDCEAT